MSEPVNRLTRLHGRLAQAFRAEGEPEVRLLEDTQMLISKDLTPNSARERGKAASFVPGPDGYQVYVSCRSEADYWATVSTSQRITGPSEVPAYWHATAIQLEVSASSLDREWRLLNDEGRVVTVHATCGSGRVVDEVNLILAEIAAALLS